MLRFNCLPIKAFVLPSQICERVRLTLDGRIREQLKSDRRTGDLCGSGPSIPQKSTRFTRIKTQLCGAIFKPRTTKVLDEIDMKKQATSLAPNVIHSLDATHMAFLVAGTSKTISHFF